MPYATVENWKHVKNVSKAIWKLITMENPVLRGDRAFSFSMNLTILEFVINILTIRKVNTE